MIRAVLFDIDGVLVDSFRAGRAFFSNLLDDMGYPKPTEAEYRAGFHLPLFPLLSHLTKDDIEKKSEYIWDWVATHRYPVELLTEPPYVKEVLEELSGEYALGIITSRNKTGLHKHYFPFSRTEKHFSVCITVEDVANHKPHPEPLLLAAKKLNVRPSECVYVGDSHSDIEAGKSAGMKTVLYGGRRNKDADIITSSFRKLPSLIEALR